MKKIMFLSLFIMFTTTSVFGQESTPTHSPEKDSISRLIATAYLQDRRADVANFVNCTSEASKPSYREKILGKATSQYDVSIKTSTAGIGEAAVVIFKTEVQGAPEDFEEKNVLENEKKLLKFVLIKEYLAKRAELIKDKPELVTTVPLDAYTKVTHSPSFMVEVMRQGFLPETHNKVKDRKAMVLTTVFLSKEFDELMKKILPQIEETPKKTDWSFTDTIVVGGLGSMAIACLVFSYKNYPN